MPDVATLRMRAEQLRLLLLESTDYKLRALLLDTAEDMLREADEIEARKRDKPEN
jgi:hypothetical protein